MGKLDGDQTGTIDCAEFISSIIAEDIIDMRTMQRLLACSETRIHFLDDASGKMKKSVMSKRSGTPRRTVGMDMLAERSIGSSAADSRVEHEVSLDKGRLDEVEQRLNTLQHADNERAFKCNEVDKRLSELEAELAAASKRELQLETREAAVASEQERLNAILQVHEVGAISYLLNKAAAQVADLHSVELHAVLSEQRALIDKLQLQIADLEKGLARLQQTVLCSLQKEYTKPTEADNFTGLGIARSWELAPPLLVEADLPAAPHCSPARSSKRTWEGSGSVQTALLGRALTPRKSNWQDVENGGRPSPHPLQHPAAASCQQPRRWQEPE